MAKQPKAGKVGESAKEKKGKQAAAAKLRRAVGSGKTIAQPPSDREADLDRAPKWQPRYPGSGRLEGKVAIVTGGDSGIGRAVSALFAREGADVAIVYLDYKADAEDTAAIIEAEGRRAVAIKADVGKAKAGEKIVARVIEKLGKLDILVNNAGEQHPAEDIRDISPEQLQQTFATNIFGMFYMVQAALPHLNRGAAIVNCTSVTMYQGSRGLLDYSATKGHHRLHPLAQRKSGGEGHPRERRRTRPDLDPAQPARRGAGGEGRDLRRRHADETARRAQ